MAARFFTTGIGLLLCFVIQLNPVQAADVYTIDPSHTSILFSVSHSGMSFTYGFFRQATGGYLIDKANPANCRFRMTIQADSLDTNHAERDKHLRNADFFNTQLFQTITFESTSCALAETPDNSMVYQVTGNLTIHGVTREVTLPVRMLGEGKGPFGDRRSGFLCQTEVKRSDFGMNKLLDLVGDAVAVTVSFEGTLKDPAAPARPGQP
jgi:polyisoprenoid-binding protein YceI